MPSVGGRPPKIYPRQILSEILEPRIEEIFHLVQQEIARSGFEDRIAAGMVLTGGCSILEGMPELAEQVFNLPVRRGVPKGVGAWPTGQEPDVRNGGRANKPVHTQVLKPK